MGQTEDNEFRVRTLQRLEILDALIVGLNRRDELMQIVAAAHNADEARGRVMATFALNEIQAVAVLDLQIRRFATQGPGKVVMLGVSAGDTPVML